MNLWKRHFLPLHGREHQMKLGGGLKLLSSDNANRKQMKRIKRLKADVEVMRAESVAMKLENAFYLKQLGQYEWRTMKKASKKCSATHYLFDENIFGLSTSLCEIWKRYAVYRNHFQAVAYLAAALPLRVRFFGSNPNY